MTSPADVGAYGITTTATIPQVGPVNVFSETFTLTVLSDCELSVISSAASDYILALISQGPTTEPLGLSNSISDKHNDSAYCGNYAAMLSPSQPFYSLSGANDLVVDSDDPAHEGIYDATLTITLSSYPNVAPFTKPIKIEVRCEILSITWEEVPPDVEIRIIVDPQVIKPFSYSHFPICQSEAKLSPGVPFTASLTALSEVQIDSDNLHDEGIYTFTLTA